MKSERVVAGSPQWRHKLGQICPSAFVFLISGRNQLHGHLLTIVFFLSWRGELLRPDWARKTRRVRFQRKTFILFASYERGRAKLDKAMTQSNNGQTKKSEGQKCKMKKTKRKTESRRMDGENELFCEGSREKNVLGAWGERQWERERVKERENERERETEREREKKRKKSGGGQMN